MVCCRWAKISFSLSGGHLQAKPGDPGAGRVREGRREEAGGWMRHYLGRPVGRQLHRPVREL